MYKSNLEHYTGEKMEISKKSDAADNRKQTKINPYDTIAELHMMTFFKSLSEKDKRHYAATEALKLPHGGITYISELFGCDRKTIGRGIKELKNPEQIVKDGIRKQGGGRKQSIDCIPNINEKFLFILLNYTAGDPMDDSIRWTHLSHQQIADRLKEDDGINISRKIVKKLFKKHGYVKRKAEKSLSTGECADRNEQFEIIAKLRAQYQGSGNPIISVDKKKKEFIGNLYRDGKVYVKEVQKVYEIDHLCF